MTLKDKKSAGQFIVTAELGPPQSANGAAIRKKSRHFKYGVDGVNITDNQTAIVRMSSIAAAKILIEEGLEPVIQMTCRDRNRIAIQSDLLGASALGIHNVLCLTGDYQSFGNQPEARGVFDLDSVQLIASARLLAEGKFLNGESIKTPPDLFVGAAANPFGETLEIRILRLRKKIKAGAQFIQTQPVFDIEKFKMWMNRMTEEGLHEKTAVLAGVMPVKSANALRYMQKEVPGMRIDPALIQRLEQAEEPKAEGIQIAVETIQELKSMQGISGIHLMPLMWESVTPRILRESGLLESGS